MKMLMKKIAGLFGGQKAANQQPEAAGTEPSTVATVTEPAAWANEGAGANEGAVATGGAGKRGMLQLLIRRVALEDEYTIGRLYVVNDGKRTYIMDTLEDRVRDVNKNGRFDNGEKKIPGETAIPYGTYEIDMNRVSPKFKLRDWGQMYDGIVPWVKNVPNFEAILIHPGNTASDTSGCILVGDNDKVGRVSYSKKYYYELMDNYLMPAKANGYKIMLTIGS